MGSTGASGSASSAAAAAAATADGFPSLGEISMGRPRRGVLIQNMPADANYKIRILDRDHKLGITAIVETVREGEGRRDPGVDRSIDRSVGHAIQYQSSQSINQSIINRSINR
jgi:hypothetical protein